MKVGDLVKVIRGTYKSQVGLVTMAYVTTNVVLLSNGQRMLFNKVNLEVISESG